MGTGTLRGKSLERLREKWKRMVGDYRIRWPVGNLYTCE